MNEFRLWLGERLAGYREWIASRDPARFEVILMVCVILGLTIILATAFLPELGGFSEGERAPRSIIAPETATVMNSAATEALRTHVAELVEPVYTSDPEALEEAAADLREFFATAARLRGELVGMEEVTAETIPGNLLDRLRVAAPATVSDATLSDLLVFDEATFDLVQTQAVGVLETVFADPITEASTEAAVQKVRALAEVLSTSAATVRTVYETTAGFVRPNQVVDEQQTLVRRQAAREGVAPVTMTVREGDRVIAEGEVVTSQDLLILQTLGLSQTRSGWKVWLGLFLLAALEGFAFSRLLHRFNKSAGLQNIMLLALVVLLLFFTLVSRLFVMPPLSAYLIPVAAMGMIVTIVLNARSAFLMVVLMSLNVGLLADLQMRYALVAIIVGVFSVYLVTRVVQRVALLGAGAIVMIISAFTIFSTELFRETSLAEALMTALWGLAHGLLAWMLTVLILLVLDTVFNLNTPLRLLELANPAHPLLKRLLQVAPGTYNHSILMGNMAEAAAEAIGADPLLARVGAYYHDIGKTVRPEYFVENQIYVDNPHDRLSPNLSKLAIAAHVRDGEHLAKLYGLPSPVIDIIRQHHGTTVMAFFYHKARESSKAPVDEENYRYEEEKPRTKEAAIIMLADGTEAAVRALQNPTRRKIQGVMQEVFKQKIEDGQLDDSDLTLADLRKIRESFDVSLRGMLGHRIRYPEGEVPLAGLVARREGGGPADDVVAALGEDVAASVAAAVGPDAAADPAGVPASAGATATPRIPPSALALRARRAAAGSSFPVSERLRQGPAGSRSADDSTDTADAAAEQSADSPPEDDDQHVGG